MNSLTLFVIHGMSAGKLLAALKGQNMSNASVIVRWRMSNLAWQEGAMKKSSHACNVIELPNQTSLNFLGLVSCLKVVV